MVPPCFSIAQTPWKMLVAPSPAEIICCNPDAIVDSPLLPICFNPDNAVFRELTFPETVSIKLAALAASLASKPNLLRAAFHVESSIAPFACNRANPFPVTARPNFVSPSKESLISPKFLPFCSALKIFPISFNCKM